MSRYDSKIRVEAGIREFLKTFSLCPFDYFYEEDARSHLYVAIDSQFQDKDLGHYTWSQLDKLSTELAAFGYEHGGAVRSSPIKTEYPRESYPDRFDIVCLESEGAMFAANIFIAIELKLGADRVAQDQCGGVNSDIQKLHLKLRDIGQGFIGVALYLYRTPPEPFQGKNVFQAWWPQLINKSLDEKGDDAFVLKDNSVNLIVAWPNIEGKVMAGVCQ